MEDDLALTGNRYQWLLTIFYIAYILFQPSTLCWKLFPPHIWATITVGGWGLFATVQAATTHWQGMMALRFLLGAIEAGFGPGVPYLLSFFYTRRELGLRVGMFFAAAPLANTFAGALAYGITSGHESFAQWRLLFLVEGIPTLLMVPVAYWYIPDTPDTARYLTEEERQVASARAIKQVGADGGQRIGHVDFHEILECLKDPIAWFTAVGACFLFSVSTRQTD